MLWLNTLVCLVLKNSFPLCGFFTERIPQLGQAAVSRHFQLKSVFFLSIFLFVCSVGLVWFAQRNDKVLIARLNRTRLNEYVSMAVSGRVGLFQLIPCWFKLSQE